MRVALYIAGAFFELGGIMLISAPDLVPGALRFARWANTMWRPIENRVRRLLRIPARGRVGSVHLTAGVELAGRMSAVKGTSATAIEEKVEFLLARDQEAQRDLNDIRQSIDDSRADLTRSLEELREEMRAHMTRELKASEAAYKTARIAGTVALALGLLLATLGNFAPG